MDRKSGVLSVFIVTLLIVTGIGILAYGEDENKNFIFGSEARPLFYEDWWDENWIYYKRIDLSDSINNYTIFLNVTKNSGGIVNCSGHCQDDFDDLRFIDADNTTVLDYWIEKYVSGGYVWVWVKLPGDIENDNHILIYYGNNAVSSASNAGDTFIYYSDFTSNPGLTNNVCSGYREYFMGNFDYTGGFVYRFDYYPYQMCKGQFGYNTHFFVTSHNESNDVLCMRASYDTDDTSSLPAVRIDNAWSQVPLNNWYRIESKYLPGLSHKLYVNGILKDTASSADSDDDFECFKWYVAWYGSGSYVEWQQANTRLNIVDYRSDATTYLKAYVDNMMLRSYAATEPSVSSVSLEYKAPPSVTYVDDDYNVSTPGWQYDHFDSIQDGIDAVIENGTIMTYNGTYYENVDVNKSLTIQSIYGSMYCIVEAANSSDHVFEVTADYVNLSGFTVKGTSSYPKAGVCLSYADFCNISDNIAINNSCGIYLYYNNNNILTGNTATNNDFAGIYLRDSDYNTVMGNTVTNNHFGIYMSNSDYNTLTGNIANSNILVGMTLYYSDTNILINNTANNNPYYGITLEHFDTNNILINNTASNNNYDGIRLEYSSTNNILTNNTVINNTRTGIRLYYSNTNTFSNNTFVNDGLFVEYSYDNHVVNNTVNGKPLIYLEDVTDYSITNATPAGQVLLVNCDNITVENLTLSRTYVGVELWETNNSNIKYNNVFFTYYGIYLSSSSNNFLTGNTATHNDYGITLNSLSNTLIDNIASSNNYYGIYLFPDSNNNTLTSNTVTNNTLYGIYFTSSNNSNNNIIYNNYFNNSNNIYDTGQNQWNITKVLGTNIIGGPYLGGNYWSDYSGDDIDGDGLGDTNLPHGPGDNLPLVRPSTVYIDDDFNSSTVGWEFDHFDVIQEGINAVADNGIVYVYNGTYYENVIVNKTIDLIGNGSTNTIIDGGGTVNVIYVSSDDFKLSGFTIQNGSSGNNYTGIYFSSNNNTITGNTITNTGNSIKLLCSSNNNITGNTIITNSWCGICIENESNNNTILGNTITESHIGILFNYYNNSYNIIKENNIVNNSMDGIWINGQNNNNTIINNIINDNYFGIRSWYPSNNNNAIKNNIINNNTRWGIKLRWAINNTIMGNTVANNEYGIDLDWLSENNGIYQNNLINNNYSSYDEGVNKWYNSTLQEGNYYSDFDEPNEGAWDNNSDGIVDTPYNIPGGSNHDLYPLMYPYGELDTTPPQITNIIDVPDPQKTGGFVNISCDVSDNRVVNGVKVNITYPDANSVNLTMDGGGTYYHNTTYIQIGTYTYFIWANDTFGNVNKSASNTFTITGYTLNINTVGNGNITKNPDQSTYAYGTTVTLTAMPDTGWTFSHWTGDLTGSTNPDTITMTGNKTVTANFTQDQYILTINTVGNGNVTKNPDQVTYTYGTMVTLIAIPDTGWNFIQWIGDLTGSTNPDNIIMTSDKTVTAIFTQDQYTLTINIVGNGTVTKDPDQVTYTYGTMVTLIAIPDTGWNFSHWSGDLMGNTTPNTITMTGHKIVTAHFTQNQYTLTINTVGNGNITKNPDQTTYTHGTIVILIAVPNTGWSFSQWSGDLTGSTNPDTITMTINKTVTATFTQDQYTLTLNIVGNGTVTKNPDQGTYTYGTSVELTAVADPGWAFSQWSGDLTGSTNPDTITMTGNKTVTATFNELIVDYIHITYRSGNEIPNQNISTGFNLTGYAQAIYETLDFISANWSVTNSGSSASTSPLSGSSSTFYSGLVDGTAIWTIDDGDGHSDTVEFSINSSLYSMMFYEDWNLVTIPFDNTWTAETLGENISGCTVVSMFDASTQTFLTHVAGVPHDDFPIVDGVGYFVYCAQDNIMSILDASIASVTVPIYADWNVVGWYHDYSTTAESLGENISGTSVVTMFDPVTQTFLTHVVHVPHDNFIIERGMAVFIYTAEASMWHGEG